MHGLSCKVVVWQGANRLSVGDQGSCTSTHGYPFDSTPLQGALGSLPLIVPCRFTLESPANIPPAGSVAGGLSCDRQGPSEQADMAPLSAL